jgi:hypothetical protein
MHMHVLVNATRVRVVIRSKVVQKRCSSDKEILVFIADDMAFGTFYLLNNMAKNMFKYQSF